MAFDGVVISGIVSDLKHRVVGGRIYKIYQPETDEICLVIKNKNSEGNTTDRLILSADAGMPLMYISQNVKENPQSAPNFCMLLRKHIGNGRIIDIVQPDFERIVVFHIEHLDEMGDLCQKKLVFEIMGKHSNIIFINGDDTIIDSIKHITSQISSVREVLPARKYVFPPSQGKVNPLGVDVNFFMNHILTKPLPVAKAIYTTVTGISPVLANELAFRAGVDGGVSTAAISLEQREELFNKYSEMMEDIRAERYDPCIAFVGYEPKEFSAMRLTMYGNVSTEEYLDRDQTVVKLYTDISEVISDYYSKKSVSSRIKQRSTDLRKIVSNAIERTSKKYDLQLAQLKDTEKRDKYKVYGELITAYGYGIKDGEKSLTCENYYTGKEITIPLASDISAMENGKKYFAKYNKLKRTYEALVVLSEETKAELEYLLSVQNSLSIAASEGDLTQIKEELVGSGYIKAKHLAKNKKQEKGKPLHYISSDGFDMYVGKNNFQNDELTFKLAQGNDMWFHAKQMPGSHVIVKLNGEVDLPDTTYEEAARLAAYYSSGRTAPKVEIDYTPKKNIKKPPKAKPGYVIYHTNYSMTIEPDIQRIKEIR